MIKKILVPLDGSELSEQILPYAQEIARRADGEVLLLTSVQLVGVWDATATAINWEREEQAARDYLAEVQQRLTGEGFRARPLAVVGDPSQAVLDAASNESADLVAMSTHGRSGIMRWLVGSVADRVVQHSEAPVLLVRPKEGTPQPSPAVRRILVPLDGSEVAAAVLPFVKEYANLFGASLVLFHAVSPVGAYPGFESANAQIVGELLEEMQNEAQTMLTAAAGELEGEGLKVTTAVSLELAADGILHAAEEAKADLIAIGTHGRSGLGRVVLGSVANAVLRRAELPCLLVRPAAGG